MLRKTKLECGHVIEVQDTATATWCPFCGGIVAVDEPVPGQPVIAGSARAR
jgi:hypothetical protein